MTRSPREVVFALGSRVDHLLGDRHRNLEETVDAELTFVGLFFVELGTLVALGFRPDPTDSVTNFGRSGEKILGTSAVGEWYNLTLLPALGYQFHTRGLPPEEQAAITVRGEDFLYRFGWAIVILGMTFQLLGHGPW